MSNTYSEDILNDPHQAGWVGAATMPGPVTRLPSGQSIPPWATDAYNNLKPFASNINTPASETGLSIYEIPPMRENNKIEFENPSLARGTKDAIIGKIKETIGKLTRKEYLKESGKDQKMWGKLEIKAAKSEGTTKRK
ncbi:7010_t:CDS:2, partial [Scutellospora calospora]